MITTMMKKEYIIPTIFFIKYEEESKLLGNSLYNADSVFAAPDPDAQHNSMDGSTDLKTGNTGNIKEGDYAKKNDWFFDDNAFSDF